MPVRISYKASRCTTSPTAACCSATRTASRAPRTLRRRRLRHRRHVHPLRRPARRGRDRRRHGALPLAPRLLQPAHRRGAARTRASNPVAAGGSIGAATASSWRGKSTASHSRRPTRSSAATTERRVTSSSSARGAAGNAAAEMLRRCGLRRACSRSRRGAGPAVDRPNLSKDYLAGNAPEEWIPLRPPELPRRARNRHSARRARDAAIDVDAHGASRMRGRQRDRRTTRCSSPPAPSRCTLALPGAELPHVHYLRTLADSRAIIAGAAAGAARRRDRRAASSGSRSAASLRTRGLEVPSSRRKRCRSSA